MLVLDSFDVVFPCVLRTMLVIILARAYCVFVHVDSPYLLVV